MGIGVRQNEGNHHSGPRAKMEGGRLIARVPHISGQATRRAFPVPSLLFFSSLPMLPLCLAQTAATIRDSFFRLLRIFLVYFLFRPLSLPDEGRFPRRPSPLKSVRFAVMLLDRIRGGGSHVEEAVPSGRDHREQQGESVCAGFAFCCHFTWWRT